MVVVVAVAVEVEVEVEAEAEIVLERSQDRGNGCRFGKLIFTIKYTAGTSGALDREAMPWELQSLWHSQSKASSESFRWPEP